MQVIRTAPHPSASRAQILFAWIPLMITDEAPF